METAITISEAETDILRSFRRYRLKANEMLFFNRTQGKDHSAKFNNAMLSMVRRGFVIQEKRHRDAYSLSHRGYQASLSVSSKA
jgi:hypothetical protein